MTKQELEKKLKFGDDVEIKTTGGMFKGFVVDFEEKGMIILLNIYRKTLFKRISYDLITSYKSGDNFAAKIGDIVKSEFQKKCGCNIPVDDNLLKPEMVFVSGTDFMMGKTPVTQILYESVMGENPSWFQLSNTMLDDKERKALERRGDTYNYPVEQVTWFDAVYFCNKLSIKEGLFPAYSVNGENNPEYWDYIPHVDDLCFCMDVQCDFSSNGYRLPNNKEWEEAAEGGDEYMYSGSDILDEVGWCVDNSNNVTHPVAQKKANSNGLYDMSGNVWEWVWDFDPGSIDDHYFRGGSYSSRDKSCGVLFRLVGFVGGNIYKGSIHSYRKENLGFRLLRKISGDNCGNNKYKI